MASKVMKKRALLHNHAEMWFKFAKSSLRLHPKLKSVR
jgi:hypothetical protein